MPTKLSPGRLDSTKDFSSLVPAVYAAANAALIQANAAYALANTGGGGGGGSGVTTYAAEVDLPASADEGSLAYVLASNKLYIFNSEVWFLLALANTPNNGPVMTIGPESGYMLSTNGSPTVITLSAQDPESTPIIWTYSITGGNITNIATIAQDNNTFTVTPSANTANAGTFAVTFTASDGVNYTNARSVFRLSFPNAVDISYGALSTSVISVPNAIDRTSAQFGKNVATHNGRLAVLGRWFDSGVIQTGNRAWGLYVYSTISPGDPVLEASLNIGDLCDAYGLAAITNPGYYGKLLLHGDMMVLGGTAVAAGINIMCWVIFYKDATTGWYISQIIYGNIPYTSGSYMPIGISGNGLTLTVGTPSGNQASGPSNPEIFIYTRASVAVRTWTLRQTLTTEFAAATPTANNIYFPLNASVSYSGKHILYASQLSGNSTGTVNYIGKVVAVTNTTYAQNNYSWSTSLGSQGNTGIGGAGNSIFYDVDCIDTNDDIFYVLKSDFFTGVAGTQSHRASLMSYIYTEGGSGSIWTSREYNSAGTKHTFEVSTSAIQNERSYRGAFKAYPGANNGVNFCYICRDPRDAGNTYFNTDLIIARAETANLLSVPNGTANNFIGSKIGTDGWAANTYVTPWVAGGSAADLVINIPNLSYTPYVVPHVLVNPNSPMTDMDPIFDIDKMSGEIFIGAGSANHSATVNSGKVIRYTPVNSQNNATAFEIIGEGQANNSVAQSQSYSIMNFYIPQNIYNLTFVGVGSGGGSGGKTTSTSSTGGAGAGGLSWITDLPVQPGDYISVYTPQGGQQGISSGVTATSGGTGYHTRLYINNVEMIRTAFGGGTSAAAGTTIRPGTGLGGFNLETAALIEKNPRSYISTYGGTGGRGANNTHGGGGGAGAGGYAIDGTLGGSTGGNGSKSDSTRSATNGVQGAGAGGGNNGATGYGFFGGGVGLYGIGSNGIADGGRGSWVSGQIPIRPNDNPSTPIASSSAYGWGGGGSWYGIIQSHSSQAGGPGGWRILLGQGYGFSTSSANTAFVRPNNWEAD